MTRKEFGRQMSVGTFEKKKKKKKNTNDVDGGSIT